MHLRLGYQDLKWKAWGGAVQFTSVGELLGCLPFPPRTFFASSHASAHWRTRLLSGILHAHGVCEKGCVCARARKDRSWGHLQLSRIRFRSPPREVGQARSFFPGTWSLGRTNECPHSHALWVYPAGKERGLQRAPPGARSLQYPARLQGAGSVSSLPALEQGCLAAAPPLHAGASL